MLKSSDRKVVSINEATANLIIAIRQQAIEDNRLEDWEQFWLRDKGMMLIWDLLMHSSHQKQVNASSSHYPFAQAAVSSHSSYS